MRYDITASRLHVLEVVAREGFSPGHYPSSYTAHIDLTLMGRWASVECLCGNSAREWWLMETLTYLELVMAAWGKLSCADPTHKRAAGVSVVRAPAGAKPVLARLGSLLRLSLPNGMPLDAASAFIARECSPEERDRIRLYLGMPSVAEHPIVHDCPHMVDWSRVSGEENPEAAKRDPESRRGW